MLSRVEYENLYITSGPDYTLCINIYKLHVIKHAYTDFCNTAGSLNINHYPTIDNNCLLSFLLMYFGNLDCKQYGP